MTIVVNESNFEEIVLKSEVPVVLDLGAEWCGPCKMVHPIVAEMSEEYEGRAKMTYLDIDGSPAITAKYKVRNIPTVLFFKDGEVKDKQVGAVPKKVLVEKLEALL